MSRGGRPAPVEGWFLETVRGVRLARCRELQAIDGVNHGFSTRVGPDGADLDVGPPGADGAARDARTLLSVAAGLGGRRLVELTQVHGNRIFRIPSDPGKGPVTADGSIALASEAREAAAAVRCADCVPILLAGLDGGAIAAIHAGWRGTASGIVKAAVGALSQAGVPAAELTAAIGPAIGSCCYEVGEDVAVAVAGASQVGVDGVTAPGRGPRLDLRRANRLQLEQAGVRPEAIHVAPWCTACDEELFFSYRRSRGLAGRQMALIGWEGLA